MAGERSPNYPSLGLDSSIQDARALYQKHGRSAVPIEVAVKALGYGTLSGASRPRVASLRQYGLIDQRVNGPLQVSNLALTLILRSPDSSEYTSALHAAALAPPLFRDLYEEWLGAPDDAVLHYLIAERRFSPEGARRALAAFRSTLDFAGIDGPATMSGLDPEEPLAEREGGMVVANAPHSIPTTRGEDTASPVASASRAAESPSVARLPSVQLPLSGLPWATLQAPFPLTESAWQQMLAVLNAMKPALVESQRPERESPTDGGMGSFTRENDAPS